MAGKRESSLRHGDRKSPSHGHFKHTVKAATLGQVLATYGLKRSDYERIQGLVKRQLRKSPAHGR